MKVPMGPLADVRVLDMSRVLAGPWATQLLADFGADVIKIERPGAGDETRAWGPPYLKDHIAGGTGESAYFLSTNRGKRSVAIDFATADGQVLIRELALQSDILIENLKVGGMKRYGLAYEDLAPLNSRLIYCSITGFGQTGPDAARAGYDAMIQGMGGLMSVTGLPDGVPGGGPQKVGVAVGDLMAGMYATSAILAALYERHQSGSGQYIDLALLDTQVSSMANVALGYLVSGQLPGRLGTAHPSIVPYQAFATLDGHLMLAIGNDRQFTTFCELAGHGQLAADARFATNAARVAHREVLVPLVADLLKSRGTKAWLGLFAKADVPCGPINDMAQVFEEPQVRHRQLAMTLTHPSAGNTPSVRNPIRYSRTAIEYLRAPPLLGQHTDEVLGERLGLEASEIEALRRHGVVA
jgi:crotonobetainyl-CoA:carnitine CoA-transferase CaiB-like acyl-CoA transferase